MPSSTPRQPLTLLVFRGERTARSFEFSEGWLIRIGIALWACLAITISSLILTARFYNRAKQADPGHSIELENQIQTLKGQLASVESQKKIALTATAAPVAAPAAPVAAPAPTTPSAVAGADPLFSALPEGSSIPTDAAQSGLVIEEAKATWSGNTLKVRFGLKPLTENPPNPIQGRIVVLARGGDALLAYPAGALNPTAKTLIQADKGEFFSVTRFRETTAAFPAVKSKSPLQSVEILVFSSDGKVLIHQTLTPTAATPKPKAAPKPADSPTAPEAAAPGAPAAAPPAGASP